MIDSFHHLSPISSNCGCIGFVFIFLTSRFLQTSWNSAESNFYLERNVKKISIRIAFTSSTVAFQNLRVVLLRVPLVVSPLSLAYCAHSLSIFLNFFFLDAPPFDDVAHELVLVFWNLLEVSLRRCIFFSWKILFSSFSANTIYKLIG